MICFAMWSAQPRRGPEPAVPVKPQQSGEKKLQGGRPLERRVRAADSGQAVSTLLPAPAADLGVSALTPGSSASDEVLTRRQTAQIEDKCGCTCRGSESAS